MLSIITLFVTMTITASAQTRGGEIKRNSSNSVSPKTTMISLPSGYINGHGYVDLGLSVKWASVNLGARNYYEKGNYYLFGAIYDSEQKVSQIESDIDGNEQYDAARFNWHKPWRLPTKQEFEELLYNCNWKKTTIKGVLGYVVTGHNGNCIFLPLTGSYMQEKELDVTGYRTGSCEVQSGILKSVFPFTLNSNFSLFVYHTPDVLLSIFTSHLDSAPCLVTVYNSTLGQQFLLK